MVKGQGDKVRRKGLTAGLRLLSLEGSAYKVDSWLISGNLAFNHSLTDETGLLYLDCTNNVIYGEHLLSFWESGIWGVARQRVPM